MISEKELVILGMLFEKPMHGYEIEKQIEETSMRDWTDLAFSSIYFILKKLEKKAFIEGRIELSDKDQARKIYLITHAGREKTLEKLREILSTRERPLWQVDLGLAYLDLLPPEDVVDCLVQYERSIDELLVGYHDLHGYLTNNQCPFNRLELTNRSIALLEAEKQWVREFIEKVRNECGM